MAFIARITEHGRRQWEFHWALQGKMANILHVIWFFLYHPRSCWKHKVLEKKASKSFHWKKMGLFFSLPNLTPFSELFKMYDGPQGILKLNLPEFGSFFGTKAVVTTKFCQIKGYHPVGKKFCTNFCHFCRLWPASSDNLWDSLRLCGIYGVSYEIISQHLTGCWKQNFFKKKSFCNEKIFWIIFSRVTEF